MKIKWVYEIQYIISVLRNSILSLEKVSTLSLTVHESSNVLFYLVPEMGLINTPYSSFTQIIQCRCNVADNLVEGFGWLYVHGMMCIPAESVEDTASMGPVASYGIPKWAENEKNVK